MTELSYPHRKFLALRQFHLFKSSLARSCIEATQWIGVFRILHPPPESCISQHCPCYFDGEKIKETKDSCVRHRMNIQGISYVTCYSGSVLFLLFRHMHTPSRVPIDPPIPAPLKIPSLIKDRLDTISTPLYSSCHTSPH